MANRKPKYEWRVDARKGGLIFANNTITATTGVTFSYRRVGSRWWTKFFLKDVLLEWARAHGAEIAAAHEKATGKKAAHG